MNNKLFYQYTVICHPDNYNYLKLHLNQVTSKTPEGILYLYRLLPDDNMPIHPTVWQFPQERYWEYDSSDESWAKFFGIGSYVLNKNERYYMVME